MRLWRTAVIGAGFIGPVHVEALRRAGVEVAAVIGSTPEKTSQLADQFRTSQSHTTLEDVLQDKSIDVVHLTTPNRLHFQQATAALRSGHHVLCEKPLAMNSRESSELVQLAQQTGLVAGVAYNIRFYPLCHEAAARVADGRAGDVLHVHGSYVQDWLLYPSDFNWRVMREDGGDLRALADIGTHWLDLIQFITGQSLISVCADLQTVHQQRMRPPGGVETFSGMGTASQPPSVPVEIFTEDGGCVMFRLSGGGHGSLWVSQTTAGRRNSLQFEIGGSRASLAWESERPNRLRIGYRDRPNEDLVRDPALLDPSAAVLTSYPGGHNEGFPDTFRQLFECFYGYLSRGDFSAPRPFPDFSDGHREVLLCEAILKSHQQRCWAEL